MYRPFSAKYFLKALPKSVKKIVVLDRTKEISFVLYGMISSVGVRNTVENQVDFTKSRNLIIAAVILVSALGFDRVGGITVPL